MKCPCEDCICVPVCRHKNYNAMLSQCSVIMDLLYDQDMIAQEYRQPRFNKNVVKVEKYLRPVRWESRVNDKGFNEIRGKEYHEE